MLQNSLFGRFQHGVRTAQHGERQDHVAVLAAHIYIAQAIDGNIPDEVGNSFNLALVLEFLGN